MNTCADSRVITSGQLTELVKPHLGGEKGHLKAFDGDYLTRSWFTWLGPRVYRTDSLRNSREEALVTLKFEAVCSLVKVSRGLCGLELPWGTVITSRLWRASSSKWSNAFSLLLKRSSYFHLHRKMFSLYVKPIWWNCFNVILATRTGGTKPYFGVWHG